VLSFPQVERALAARRYERALALIEKQRQEAGEVAADVLDLLAGRARRGREVLRLVASAGEKVKGVRLSVRLAGMRVRAVAVKATAEGVEVEAAGVRQLLPPEELAPLALYRLAAAAAGKRARARLLLARFLLDAGESEEAATLLGELARDPEVGEEARRLLSDL